MKKRVYLLPSVITAFGLTCGLLVIFKSYLLEREVDRQLLLTSSIMLLLLAAFADLLDGAVARLFKAESEFGALFDSLSDAISFGVAPAILFLKYNALEAHSGLAFCLVLSCMVYSICGVLRLVRFNVSKTEVGLTIEEELAKKRYFTGLPIPAAALASVSALLLLLVLEKEQIFSLSSFWNSLVLCGIESLLGFLMISRWKFPSLKALHLRVPSLRLMLSTVVIAIFFLYGIFNFFPFVLFGLIWGYILVSLILSFIRLLAGRKSETLKDFEPEEEDE